MREVAYGSGSPISNTAHTSNHGKLDTSNRLTLTCLSITPANLFMLEATSAWSGPSTFSRQASERIRKPTSYMLLGSDLFCPDAGGHSIVKVEPVAEISPKVRISASVGICRLLRVCMYVWGVVPEHSSCSFSPRVP